MSSEQSPSFVPSLQAQPWMPGTQSAPKANPTSETQSCCSPMKMPGSTSMTSMSQASFEGCSWAADDGDFFDSMLDGGAGKKKANTQKNKANQWKQTKFGNKGTSPAMKPQGAPTTAIASLGRFEALQPASFRGSTGTRANFGSWRK